MKMIDMGRKNDSKLAEVPTAEKNVIHYPTLSLYNSVPEEIFKKEIGTTFEIKAVCKLVSKGIDENTKRKDKRVSLDILKLGLENAEKDLEDEINKQSGTKEE